MQLREGGEDWLGWVRGKKEQEPVSLLHVVLAAYLPLRMYVLHTTVPPVQMGWRWSLKIPFAVGMSAVRRHGIFCAWFVRCGRFSLSFFLCRLERIVSVHLLSMCDVVANRQVIGSEAYLSTEEGKPELIRLFARFYARVSRAWFPTTSRGPATVSLSSPCCSPQLV